MRYNATRARDNVLETTATGASELKERAHAMEARRMVASRTGIPVLMHWIEALQRCWHLGPSSASGSARARMAKIERAFRRTVRGGALWSGLSSTLGCTVGCKWPVGKFAAPKSPR